MRRLVPLVLAAATAACGWVSFGRRVTDDEVRLRGEIRSYYDSVAVAFAAGNAEALEGHFDPAIARPMTRAQIRAWGEKFFREHGPATFHLHGIEYERLGYGSATVVIRYRVEPRSGTGAFGGTERDELVKRGGRWWTAAWEKL